MSRRRFDIEAERAAAAMRATLAEDLRRLREDAGITLRALAAASGVPQGYVSRILMPGSVARPSDETYARLAAGLGARHFARIYPDRDPPIRDRHQARIEAALLGSIHPRWRPFAEVRVRSPASGWVDVVVHDARAQIVVAIEIESDIRRLEHQLRRGGEKVDSLPSWARWAELAGPDGASPAVSRALVVRRTRTTRRIAADFARILGATFPAHPDDALAALFEDAPWPGAALIWADLDGEPPRFLRGR